MNVGDRFEWLCSVIAAQPRPTLAEVAVATVLARHFNAARGAAWPAQRTMAELLRMDRRTIRRGLDGLEERGLIRCVTPGNPRRSAGWCLAMPDGDTLNDRDSTEDDPHEGATQRRPRARESAPRGRSAAPGEGGAHSPEQVSRSESVGKPYRAASRASADAERARGATGFETMNFNPRRSKASNWL